MNGHSSLSDDMNENIYNPACPKQETEFNSQISFSDTAHEVTVDQRNAALDFIDQLIDHTKKTISEKD